MFVGNEASNRSTLILPSIVRVLKVSSLFVNRISVCMKLQRQLRIVGYLVWLLVIVFIVGYLVCIT